MCLILKNKTNNINQNNKINFELNDLNHHLTI